MDISHEMRQAKADELRKRIADLNSLILDSAELGLVVELNVRYFRNMGTPKYPMVYADQISVKL